MSFYSLKQNKNFTYPMNFMQGFFRMRMTWQKDLNVKFYDSLRVRLLPNNIQFCLILTIYIYNLLNELILIKCCSIFSNFSIFFLFCTCTKEFSSVSNLYFQASSPGLDTNSFFYVRAISEKIVSWKYFILEIVTNLHHNDHASVNIPLFFLLTSI